MSSAAALTAGTEPGTECQEVALCGKTRAALCGSAGHEYDSGVIITASHLPYNRNGFKYFTREGGFEKGDITDLLQRAATAASAAGVQSAAKYTDDAHVFEAALQTDPQLVQQVSFALQHAYCAGMASIWDDVKQAQNLTLAVGNTKSLCWRLWKHAVCYQASAVSS